MKQASVLNFFHYICSFYEFVLMEEEVILQVKNGDKAAFELLYKRYWRKVYNFTNLYIASAIDVEEVVQEVFIKIWEARAFVDETKNFEGFLFIVTRNLIFNRFRSSFNEAFYQMTVLESVADSYNVEDELVASDLHNHLKMLLEMLPPRQRDVFHLSRQEHLTYKEISLHLQISEKTVEHHISNVLKFLKRNLELYSIFAML